MMITLIKLVVTVMSFVTVMVPMGMVTIIAMMVLTVKMLGKLIVA